MSTQHLTNTEVSFQKFIIDFFFHIKILLNVSGQSKTPRMQRYQMKKNLLHFSIKKKKKKF